MADFARSAHPGVQAQLDRLSMLSPAGDRLGLERICALLDRLGNPQRSLPPVFHVAGTNGKGSTIAFLRAGLEASGHATHVFTSPHLVRFNERIRIAGELIGDEELSETLTEVIDAGEGIEPSFFEVATATALLAFSRSPAAACILEVGLGGRLDATNVIERPLVTGISGLALDHQQFLGTELAGIAGEKAAIAKAGTPLVTLRYPPEIAARVGEVARDKGAFWLPQGDKWDAERRQERLWYQDHAGHLSLPLPTMRGGHQAMNAALAIAMLRHQQKLKVPDRALEDAVANASWPARLQRLSAGPLVGTREVWLDGGHNPAAACRIASWARNTFGGCTPPHLVFASLTSKDPAGMLEPFKGLVAEVHAVPIPGHDCVAPAHLVEIADGLALRAHARTSVADALNAIQGQGPVLIFGSLYLAGAVLAANDEIPT